MKLIWKLPWVEGKTDFPLVILLHPSSRPANSLVSYMESHDEKTGAYKQIQYGNGILKTSLDARMSQLGSTPLLFHRTDLRWYGSLASWGTMVSIDENGRTGPNR